MFLFFLGPVAFLTSFSFPHTWRQFSNPKTHLFWKFEFYLKIIEFFNFLKILKFSCIFLTFFQIFEIFEKLEKLGKIWHFWIFYEKENFQKNLKFSKSDFHNWEFFWKFSNLFWNFLKFFVLPSGWSVLNVVLLVFIWST